MRDIDITLEDLGASIPDTSVERLRLQGTMLKRLPSIPGISVDRFFMSDRAAEAEALARAIGIAYEEDRRRAVIMRAKSRAEERLAMLYALGRI